MKKILLYGLLLLASTGIQAQELLPWPTDTIDGKVYYRYTVEKSIGLYRISKNFGVSQEAILEANPVLKTRGLHFEEVILVPANLPATPKVLEKPVIQETTVIPEQPVVPEPPQQESQAAVAEPMESIAPAEPAAPAEPTDLADAKQPIEVAETLPDVQLELPLDELQDEQTLLHYTDTVRLAVLLPLQAEVAQRSPTIDRFYDFYCGALLAIKHQEFTYVDSLGAQHTPYYDVHTYDVGKNARVICQLLDSGALAQMDFIIGPAYSKQVEALDVYAQEHAIPVMIPFLQQLTPSRMQMNPYVLKFNPSEQIHTHALMEYLDTLRNTINIVLVDAYADKSDYSSGLRILRDSIEARGLSTTHTSIRQILADSVGAALKDSVENILLFHSERYSNVQLLMPYLLSGKRGKQLTVLSQYAWQTEHILLPQLFSTVFRTPGAETVARYEQDFARYFGHQLSSTQPRYDLLGYDLTNYMLQALRDGVFHAPDTITEGIQSSLLFKQNEHGGYENTHIVIEKR